MWVVASIAMKVNEFFYCSAPGLQEHAEGWKAGPTGGDEEI